MEYEAVAPCGDVFSFVDAVVDVGDGCDGEGMILMPQPLPTSALGVGRMVQKFGVD